VILLFPRGCAAISPVPRFSAFPHPGQTAPHVMEFTITLPRLCDRQVLDAVQPPDVSVPGPARCPGEIAVPEQVSVSAAEIAGAARKACWP
jgi:hypothetical protein